MSIMLKLVLFTSLFLVGFVIANDDSSHAEAHVPPVAVEDNSDDGDHSYEEDNYESYGDESYGDESYGDESYGGDSYGDYDGNDSQEQSPPYEETAAPTKAPLSNLEKMAKNYQKFVMKMWSKLDADAPNTNTLFSPLSLFSTLVTLQAAARKSARRQLNDVLRMKSFTSGEVGEFLSAISSTPEDSYKLKSVNRVYLSALLNFSRKFKKDLKDLKVVEKKKMDFSQLKESRAKINKFVRRQTAGFIPKLLPPGAVTELTRVYFVNALYLKASWDAQFTSVAQGKFTTYQQGNAQVDVQMMRNRNSDCKVFGHEGTMIVSLPLDHGNLEMAFLMPDNGHNFEHFLNATNEKANNKMIRLLNKDSMYPLQNCDVTMPKFTLSHRVEDMIDTLKKMGVTEVFEDDQSLSRMLSHSSQEPVLVRSIEHQTKLVVDEHGIEGAAATALQLTTRMMPPSVRIDRPFYFLVRHKANRAVVFMGKVTDPSQLV